MASTDRRLAALVVLALALFVALPLVFVGFGAMGAGHMDGTWGYGPMMDGAWGAGTAGWVVLLAFAMRLLFFVALLGGAYLLYRAVTSDDDTDPALEELRAAYARGDLTDDEYEERRERLERDR
ncbi:SHOCT domain-containing protein [Halobacterium litoreum]|uniref:SHOCT domain-containing protein n=1 Tax=Halobacterium litoreum TaxID=2039234 RepID=A0ABD5NH55_9EURY|nr:SHOCT domain-containing protein [Halobacterium litoreum]UHH12514.1 SHOCT domain-containing protein [Halobacterium litoreum]